MKYEFNFLDSDGELCSIYSDSLEEIKDKIKYLNIPNKNIIGMVEIDFEELLFRHAWNRLMSGSFDGLVN